MTFLSILGNTEILCNLKLVLQGKAGKEILELSRLEFLANDFALSDAEDNTSVENTISISPKIMRAKFQGSNRLFYFVSICKFGSFNNLLQRFLASLNFTLESEDLSFWYKRKK